MGSEKKRRLILVAICMLVLLVPGCVFADAYDETEQSWVAELLSSRGALYFAQIGLPAIIVGIGGAISLRNHEKTAKKNKEAYHNRHQIQEAGTTYFVRQKFPGSQTSAAKKVKPVMESAYETVVKQYEDSMKKYVMDIDHDIQAEQAKFTQAVYEEALAQAMGAQAKIPANEARFRDFLGEKYLKPGKVGSAYALLLTFWLRKKVSADDIKAVKIFDADAVSHFKKCYYEAMKIGCRELSNLKAKCIASHYWHARILQDISYSELDIVRLDAMGAFEENEGRNAFFRRRAFEYELAEFEPAMRRYILTGELVKDCYETDEQLNELIDSIDIAIFDETEIMREV